MSKTQTKIHKRINICLSEETIMLVDRIVDKGNRSHFIDEAVRFYVDQKGRENLRAQIKKGALARAQRDLALSEEWFRLEEEICLDKEK